MNWDRIKGKWDQTAGKIKEKWGKLTDDDLTAINGKREQLVGKIQERYGIAKEAAEKQVDEFTLSYRAEDSAAQSAKSS
ncbi:MAG: CsbD family protein [Candidatus Acidiferrales bacterium]